MTRIHMTIDQLVMHGVEPSQREAFVEGLRTELEQMLRDPRNRASWNQSRRTPVLKVGRMPLDPGPSGGRAFGGGLARAIGRGMKP